MVALSDSLSLRYGRTDTTMIGMAKTGNKKRMALFLSVLMLFFIKVTIAQTYWQQHVVYNMDVKLDVNSNILTGTQQINYTNNSPDTLKRLYFHLFYNAFRPGSMMDELSAQTESLIIGRDSRGRDLVDFDPRFKNKIYNLAPNEQGFVHITQLLVDGKAQDIKEHETILEVLLAKPILPKQQAQIRTSFESQVPKLSRRSGRDNIEGIRYSMGQWYPKLCEYDKEGWHPDDYVSREFYGPWGDFNVNITLDKNYKLGATGVLQNADEIGWGYDKEGTGLKKIAAANRTWKFKAANVHDFAWVADTGYIHFTRKVTDGPLLHFIYKYTTPEQQQKWYDIADSTALAYPYMAKTFGPYAYPVYSFLHGGGGGTEYPMATMLRGAGLDGAIHEWMHSWYQMMLASNEVEHAWMDEGFTSYADDRVQAWLKHQDSGFIYRSAYDRYIRLAKSRFAEPMSTHSNFTATNYAYNNNAYVKGEVFLEQLGYITGADMRDSILLAYYYKWRFKHPDPDDFIHVAELTSGMQLKWYLHYWTNTLKTIDYKVDSLWSEDNGTNIRVRRIGEMPMPLDIVLTFKDGTQELHYIPLNLMLGAKQAEDSIPLKLYPAQPFTKLEAAIHTERKLFDITSVEIDPSQRMADVDRRNNKLELHW